MTAPRASIILPAHDEEGYIGSCLAALFASEGVVGPVEVIVIANGCHDDTAGVARAHAGRAEARGWSCRVIETVQGGKLGALNLGDQAAGAATRIYLDADVTVSPALISELLVTLDTDTPRYATGTPQVAAAQSVITRAYARFWQTLPFFTDGAPGFGIFAVNAAGRQRWGDFPDIISDDTFVRLQFTPAERVRVPAPYVWPMVEGLGNLIRVRRRQDRGVQEIAARFPELLAHADHPPLGAGGVVRRALRDPWGFAVYAAVSLAVRLPVATGADRWTRGR